MRERGGTKRSLAVALLGAVSVAGGCALIVGDPVGTLASDGGVAADRDSAPVCSKGACVGSATSSSTAKRESSATGPSNTMSAGASSTATGPSSATHTSTAMRSSSATASTPRGSSSGTASSSTSTSGVSSCIADVQLGWSHSCALKTDGTVWCWGNNNAGQLASASESSNPTPAPIAGITDAIGLAMGDSHSCALLSGGTVSCWGYNSNGQVGDGTSGDTRTSPVPVVGLSGAVQVTAGGDDSCALTSAGAVWCWGGNSDGQVGDGTMTDRSSAVQVKLLENVKSIACGWNHACALGSSGTAYCWGDNTYGELGDGTHTSRPTASVAVINPDFSTGAVFGAIGAGFYHSCAIDTDGTVWCWGLNNEGQLGDGTTDNRSTAVQAATMGNTVAVSMCGYSTVGNIAHTCARSSGGAVSCWGDNGFGEIGDGTMVNRASPTAVGALSGVLHMSAGAKATCAVVPGGAPVSCWGANDVGELGNGTMMGSPVPVSTLLSCP
jgi:alpha-tubulin suppressor-like RCC1 family protein